VESAAYALLAHLIVDGPRRTTALAEAVHSDPSTVSRQTAAMVRLGLIERRPDPMDGRACLLAATEKGEQVFADHRKCKDEHLAAMLADWSAADLRRFAALLDRFNNDFEAYRPQLFGASRDMVHPDMVHRDEGETVR
jgi:DNA-binding MarR family transcriptional regulator